MTLEADGSPLTEAEVIALSNRVLSAGIDAIDRSFGEGSAKEMPALLAKYLEVTVTNAHNELMNAAVMAANAAGGIPVMCDEEET